MKPRTAITGGVGEGKSTVLGYLADLGFSVASADDIAREVFASADVQASIAKILEIPPPVPPELLRNRLEDVAVRRAVNAITHPRILSKLCSSRAQFFEVPLLIETCLHGAFDRVWVVTCGPAEQRRRLSQRLGDSVAAEALIRTQLTSRVKIPFADCLIRTNRAESTVKRFVAMAAQWDLR